MCTIKGKQKQEVNKMTNIILMLALSVSLFASPVSKIETTETGALITFEDGTGYYWEAE